MSTTLSPLTAGSARMLTIALSLLRYPTFPDALRDLPDALSLLSLFALLTTTPTPTSTLPPTLTINCARLMAEWKLYVMRSKCLRKVFFSIKGVYYQVEIGGEKVTWLEGYAFTQHVSTSPSSGVALSGIVYGSVV